MKKFLEKILILQFSILGLNPALAQCNVTINASALSVPCGGSNVTLTAIGSGYNTTPINNSFDLGNAGPNWSISPAGQFNNPCGPSVDGGIYMWMGSSTAAPRTLQTAPLDLTCGGNVCFYLKFAQQGNSSPCEGPDLTTEGVYFQYSINGGTTWTTINYFQPNAGGTTGPYLNWAQYCFPIPAVAQTTSTILRWYQGGSSGFGYDHWGIDNVVVTATNCGSVWYDWVNISGTTGPNGDPASQNVFVQSDSTFTVCYTDGGAFNCCQNITILVQGLNAPNANVTNESCPGNNDGSVVLSSTGGVGPYEYHLLSGPGISLPLTVTSPAPSPTFFNLQPGTYAYEINDLGSSCSVSGTFVVSSPPQFVIDQLIISDENCVSSCDGSVDVIAPGGVSFALDNGAVSNTSLIDQLCPGTYNVVATSLLGCVADTSFTIAPAQPINLIVSADTLICENGTATLIAEVTGGSGNYVYNWDNGQTNDTILVTPLVPLTSTVSVTDGNGCTTPVQDVFVDILPPLSLTLTQNYIVCEGETIELLNQVTGGDGVYSYNWLDNNTGVVFSTDAFPDFAVNSAMNLTLIVEDGCETTPATGGVTVGMFAVPDIFISATPTPGCTPLQVYFNTITDLSNVNNFSWDLGIALSSDTSPVVTYINEGCHDITFTLETNDGCINTYTENDFVCAYLSPVADFQFINEEFSGLAPSFGVVNTSSFQDFNSWQVTAENFSYSTNDYDFQIDLPTEFAGDYEVCLNVSTNFGCVDSLCKLFAVQDVVTVYVPNTFTPDGNEYNNVFMPILSGIDQYNYLLEIYNRWGEKIFESRNAEFGWDGTYNGKIVPQGTYTWKITARVLALGNSPITKTGFVNLIR